MSDSWTGERSSIADASGTSLEPVECVVASSPYSPYHVFDEVILAEPVESSRPRVWTVFLAVVVAVLAALVVSTVVTFAVLRLYDGPSTPAQAAGMRPQLMEFMESKPGFLVMVLPGQATFLAIAVFAAWMSPQPFRERLTLLRGRFPVWVWLVLAAATPMVGFLTALLLSMFTSDRGSNMETMQRVFRAHSGPFFALIVVAVGVLPGICEELLFRGYMQTRLLARFPAAIAIGISALFFSAAHLDPLHIISVFPIGVWLGIIAWKAGSLWPAMLGHTVNNSLAVLMTQIQPDPDSPTVTLGVGLAVTAGLLLTGMSFLVSLVILIVARPPISAREARGGEAREREAREGEAPAEPYTPIGVDPFARRRTGTPARPEL